MKAVSKVQLLQRLEDTVEQHLRETIRVFQNLPESDLLKPAANGGWSIAACLAHLNSYGDYYLPRIKAGVACQKGMPVEATFRSSWIGRLFIRMMDPATGTKKYKAIAAHQPPADLNPYAVVREFIRQQEELLLCLRSCQDINLNSIQIPTSVLSWVHLKLGDVLQFLIAHNHRHLLQARRNLSETKVCNSNHLRASCTSPVAQA
ncbi:DinB family protein [Pontibacter harenae]|uniref:DinB family protein n=1 Tax=Pontibacter harenae TaxID=2894083 RepID=UPI001E3186A8|nr:DinB family protein [Pontibacter harenae]MCC9168098.1 DinB family protein [Pontibacter harenae]